LGVKDVFFYGLFMDGALLRAKGVHPREPRCAVVQDKRLHIANRATLVPDPEARAYGRAFSLEDPDLDTLYGEPDLAAYRPESVLAALEGGMRSEVTTYTLPAEADAGPQDPAYAAKLRDALATLQQEAYHAVSAYTLEHARTDAAFIHQHVVDTYTLQHAGPGTRPIAIAFSLMGLYLHMERGFTGRQVQLVHMKLARQRHAWPELPLPSSRGDLTSVDVLVESPGPERDAAIHAWCASVWHAFAESRPRIVALLKEHGIDA
jgi:hypothetical protein